MGRHLSLGFTLFVGVATVIVASFPWYSPNRSSSAQVAVQIPAYDVDQIGAGSQLTVEVRNTGTTAIRPTFWVMWSAFVRPWEVEEGPPILGAGLKAHYTIRVSDLNMAVPIQALYIVKVFDQNTGVYFRSETYRLELTGRPVIRNPELRFWSRDPVSGLFQPFGWVASSRVSAGDAVLVGPANGSRGAKVWIHEDGTGMGYTLFHLVQALGRAQILELRTAPVSLCWNRAVEYWQGPVSGAPRAASGIELSAGGRLAWFALSWGAETIVDLPNHRIFIAHANANSPGCAHLPISEMIDFIGGSSLDQMALVLFAAVSPDLLGDHLFIATSVSVG